MYASIFSKYYWRTMYVDVGNYCRRCEKCNEITVTGYRDVLPQPPTATAATAAAPEVAMGQAGEDHMHDDDESQKITTLPTDRIIRVWKKVCLLSYLVSFSLHTLT